MSKNRNNINTKKNSEAKEKSEQLSNRSVMLTTMTVLYAMLLLFLQRMSKSSVTVLGAQAFIQILFWGSIVGAMVCAALGAYKEKKTLFTYSGMFVYILWSMIVIQYCGIMGADKAYALVYASIVVVFVMIQLYSFLAGKGSFENNKKTLVIFTTVSIVLFVVFCILAVALRFRFFGIM